MKETLAVLNETAAALDQHYASGRFARVVGATALVTALSGGIAATEFSSDPYASATGRIEYDANVVHEDMQSVTSTIVSKPRPVGPLMHLTAPRTTHRAVAPTTVHPGTAYPQIQLETQHAARPQFADLLRHTAKPAFTRVVDISYPQCPALEAATVAADTQYLTAAQRISNIRAALHILPTDYLIIGATHGHNFSTNQCLKQEVELAGAAGYGIYINSGYNLASAQQYQNLPTSCKSNEKLCIARNYGTEAARYALLAIQRAGATSPDMLVVDFETANSWEGSQAEHVADAKAMYESLTIASPDSHKLAYSVPARPATATKKAASGMWRRLMGNWRPQGIGSWIAGGNNTESGALASCEARPSITAGPNLLSQLEVNGLDYDVICPNASVNFKR